MVLVQKKLLGVTFFYAHYKAALVLPNYESVKFFLKFSHFFEGILQFSKSKKYLSSV